MLEKRAFDRNMPVYQNSDSTLLCQNSVLSKVKANQQQKLKELDILFFFTFFLKFCEISTF
jgi:hypothetical protein